MATEFRALYLWFCLTLGLILLMATAQAAEKVRFGTPIKGQVEVEVPILAAEEKGYWKQNDLDVQWFPFDSGASLTRAHAGGAVDISYTIAVGYIAGVARGVPIIMVADLHFRNDFYIWVRPDGPMKEPKDLKGARVGVAALGGAAHAYGMAATKALGMEKDVKFVGAGGQGAMVAALKARSIDAALQAFFAMAPVRFKGEVKPFLNMRDFLPREWVDGILQARLEFVEKSPGAVKRTVRAYLQAAAFVMENPDWALAKLKGPYGYPEDAARGIYDAMRYGRDGKINVKGVENIKNFLLEYDIVPKDKMPPLERLFSAKFTD